MKTSSAKAKGRRCAQEVVDLLRKYWPAGQQDDIWVTPSSVTGEDIKMSPLARKEYPVTIECKNVESLNVWQSLEQSESHALNTGYTPILFFRRNRSKLYAALAAEDLIKLLRGIAQIS